MIKIIAHDQAKHRIERLNKTLRISREILALSESQANLLIYAIIDRKGHLRVEWNAEPTSRQTDAFAAAWELVGENPSAVCHIVRGAAV